MNSRFISSMILMLVIGLAGPGFAGPANAPGSQPGGQDTAQLTTFALDALAVQAYTPRPADWPVTSADILAGYRSFNDWPDAERWFMLTQLEKEAQKTPAIDAWLHEEHPLQKAQMRFEVQSMLGIGSQYGTVSMEAWDGGPLTDEKLGKFIENLSPAQITALLAKTIRLPIADLTPAQKDEISSVFKDMPSVNGITAMNLPDAYLYFRFQFYVNTKIQGNLNTFETLIGAF